LRLLERLLGLFGQPVWTERHILELPEPDNALNLAPNATEEVVAMSTLPTVVGLAERWEAIRKRLPTVNPVFRGHPLHAVLTDLPVALVPTGFGLSLLGWLRDDPRLEAAGYLNTVTGLAASVPTALTGLADYVQMEARDPAQQTGATHALLNTTAIVLGALSLRGRTLGRPRSRRGLWLSGLATGLFLGSAYLGGDLVYHRGWRVKPIEREEIETHRVPPTIHDDDFLLRRARISSAAGSPPSA
jgi:uncharacterized membrane protein